MVGTFELIAKNAVRCSYCFTNLDLQHARIDIAQPRWIGPRYSKSKPKTVVVMLNPAAGNGRGSHVHQNRRQLIQGFRNGRNSLSEVFDEQGKDFSQFGRGRFQPFLENTLGIPLNDVALLNIAWCATEGDQYPKEMLNKCYDLHTSLALQSLAPDIIVLCGLATHDFRERMQTLLPRAKLFLTLHYAHRKSRQAEWTETDSVRGYIAAQRNANR